MVSSTFCGYERLVLSNLPLRTSQRVKRLSGARVMTCSRSLDRSIAQSLDRSLDRSIARSIDRSLARSLARSLDRSLDRSLNRSVARSVARSPDRLHSSTAILADELFRGSSFVGCLSLTWLSQPQAYLALAASSSANHHSFLKMSNLCNTDLNHK